MRQQDALNIFHKMDRNHGRRVYTKSDLRKIFPDDSERALMDGIDRMVRSKVLERPAKGIYVYALSQQPRTHLLYEVARALRRGCYTYLSMESALSEFGVISQVPSGHHTFVTTGRKSEFKTDYGTIEFTRTTRDPAEFVPDLIDNGRPLPIASVERAIKDLRRAGRNLTMVQEDELREELARAAGADCIESDEPEVTETPDAEFF
jgi:predicted transcriptional regulator of viral defense system